MGYFDDQLLILHPKYYMSIHFASLGTCKVRDCSFDVDCNPGYTCDKFGVCVAQHNPATSPPTRPFESTRPTTEEPGSGIGEFSFRSVSNLSEGES